jgi:hypothetical protein
MFICDQVYMSLEVIKDSHYHILSKSIHLERLTDGPVDANGMSHIGKKQVWNISVTFYHIFSSIQRSWREWTVLYRHSVKASQFINSEIRVLLEELTVSTASQIPRLLCNPTGRKSPNRTVFLVTWIQSTLSNTISSSPHFNIVLSFIRTSSELCPPFNLWNQNFVRISCFPYAYCMLHPSDSP